MTSVSSPTEAESLATSRRSASFSVPSSAMRCCATESSCESAVPLACSTWSSRSALSSTTAGGSAGRRARFQSLPPAKKKRAPVSEESQIEGAEIHGYLHRSSTRRSRNQVGNTSPGLAGSAVPIASTLMRSAGAPRSTR